MQLGVKDREGEGAEWAINSRHPLAELIPVEWTLAEDAKEGELKGFTSRAHLGTPISISNRYYRIDITRRNLSIRYKTVHFKPP